MTLRDLILADAGLTADAAFVATGFQAEQVSQCCRAVVPSDSDDCPACGRPIEWRIDRIADSPHNDLVTAAARRIVAAGEAAGVTE